jgi:hypothetical protein
MRGIAPSRCGCGRRNQDTHQRTGDGAASRDSPDQRRRYCVDDRGSGAGAGAGLGTITPASGVVLPLHGVIIGTTAQKMSMVMMI